MKNIRNIINCVAFVVMLVAVSGIVLFACPEEINAQRQVSPGGSYGGSGGHGGYGGGSGGHGGSYGGYHGGYHGSGSGYGYRGYGYGHGYYGYPYHGYYGHYYRGGWYYGGWWYPWAWTVAFLPPYYATYWWGGYPYYYADGYYYAPVESGYMVVNPPGNQTPAAAPPVAQAPNEDMKLYIYPRKGQTEKQQSDDRYQCHGWAVGQTGYDPTAAGAKPVQKRSDYQRAMSACLDARGYTAR